MTSGQKQALIDYLSGFINQQRRDLLRDVLSQRTRHITVVLEDIYQPQNSSAVVRTCECLGIQSLHVIENYNAYQINPDVVRGASKWIDINRFNNNPGNNSGSCLHILKKKNYKIAAMTPAADAIKLDELPIDEKLALCFGSEENGLSATGLRLADYRVKIPMQGFTQSYNISVTAGIALYALTQRLRRSDIDWQLDAEEAADIHIKWLVNSTPNGKILKQRFLETQK